MFLLQDGRPIQDCLSQLKTEFHCSRAERKIVDLAEKWRTWKLVDFKLHLGNLILETLTFLKLNYYYHFVNKVTRPCKITL